MYKGLEALERLNNVVAYDENEELIPIHEDLSIIEKELKELDKIKARLVVVNMKLNSKRKECVENMNHTDEDAFVHEASRIGIDYLDWFREILKEVLL